MRSKSYSPRYEFPKLDQQMSKFGDAYAFSRLQLLFAITSSADGKLMPCLCAALSIDQSVVMELIAIVGLITFGCTCYIHDYDWRIWGKLL